MHLADPSTCSVVCTEERVTDEAYVIEHWSKLHRSFSRLDDAPLRQRHTRLKTDADFRSRKLSGAEKNQLTTRQRCFCRGIFIAVVANESMDEKAETVAPTP